MRRISIYGIVILLSFGVIPVEAGGLRYSGTDPYKALEQARVQRRMLLVEFYADWSYKSRWMHEKVLEDSSLRSLIEDHFLVVRVDTGTQEGGRLAQLYEVTGYPVLVIFNSNGAVLDKIDTTLDRQDFRQRIEALLLVTEGGGGIYRLEQVYAAAEGGDRHMADVYAAQYLAGQDPERVIGPVVWPLFEHAMATFYYSSAFDYLLTHVEAFRKEIGREEVDGAIAAALLNGMLPYVVGTVSYAEEAPEDMIGIAEKQGLPVATVLRLMHEAASARTQKKWGAYVGKLSILLDRVPESMQFPLILSVEPIVEEGTRNERNAAYRLVGLALSAGGSVTDRIILESLRERLK